MFMADVMFVNGTALIMTSSNKNKFVIFNHIQIRTAGQLNKSLNKVIKLYRIGGFIICVTLMHMEYEKVADMLGKL